MSIPQQKLDRLVELRDQAWAEAEGPEGTAVRAARLDSLRRLLAARAGDARAEVRAD